MSDARFTNNQSSILLPDDEIDKDKLDHFIHSNLEPKVIVRASVPNLR